MMPTPLELQSETLFEILAAQCADLESLLGLARRECEATQQRDFETVMEIVGERATVGERLEVYHRQIAELRQRLSEPGDNLAFDQAAARAVQLIVDIQAQDHRNGLLLRSAQQTAAEALTRLDKGARGLNGYLRDARSSALTCDRVC